MYTLYIYVNPSSKINGSITLLFEGLLNKKIYVFT